MYQYKPWDKVHNVHVYRNIVKVMYGLPESGILAYKQLATFMNHLNSQKDCGHTKEMV